MTSRFAYWLRILTEKREQGTALAWEVIDGLFAAQAELSEEFEQLVYQLGLAEHTVANYLSLARKFPPHVRMKSLSVSHYTAVQGLPSEKACAILAHAQARADASMPLTVRDTVAMRRALEGRAPTKPDITWDATRARLADATILLRECQTALGDGDLRHRVEAWLLRE